MNPPLSRRCVTSLALVAAFVVLGANPPATAQPSYPATEAGVRALLAPFLPGSTADTQAAMQRLKPGPADYRAVYNEPLAGKLENAHRALWLSGETIGGRPDQTELLVVLATTDDLIDGTPLAREFPGGYGSVAGAMKRGIPIVMFRFVQPGSRSGMAFDGLVHVNGHWVLIPKPWRSASP